MVSRADRSPFAEWWWTVDKLLLGGLVVLMLGGVVLSLAGSPAVAERLGYDSFHFVKRHLLFFLPGREETLRVNGDVWITNDPDLLAAMSDRGKAPRLGIGLTVRTAFLQCAKALAALAGHESVEPGDLLDAAGLALGHRVPVDPFEPTSGLDPISTAKVEESLQALKRRYAIVIVPHSVQQAARIADSAAFMLMGDLIEAGPGTRLFTKPADERTENYVMGRFG